MSFLGKLYYIFTDPGILFYPFSVIKWIQANVIDTILMIFCGFSTIHGFKRDWEESQTCYEKSAQIVDVWGKASLSYFIFQRPENFLYTHSKYVHPNYILSGKHISLHGVTKTHAYFCVTDRNVDVTDMDR